MKFSDLIEGLQMQTLSCIVYHSPLTDSELITLAEYLPNNHSVSSLSLNVSQLKTETLNVLRNAMSDNHSIVTINWQSYNPPMHYELSFQELCARNQATAIALARACVEGNAALVESLLKQGVSIYTVPALCQQPIIHQAIATSNPIIVRLFFKLRPMLDLDFAKGTASSVLTDLNRIEKDWLPPLLGEFSYRQGVFWERSNKFQKAVIYYQLGAEKNHPRAQLQLGLYHIEGWGGLPCNLKKAHFYLKLAAEANIDRAKRNLAKLESEHPELLNSDNTQPIFLEQPPPLDLIGGEKKALLYSPLISSVPDDALISFSSIPSFSNDGSLPFSLRELIRSEMKEMYDELSRRPQASRVELYSQNQKQFNQIARTKLEQLLIGAMAVASGRVTSKVGLLPNVIQGGIELLGSLFPVPGASLLSFFFKQGVQKNAVKERYCEAKQLNSCTMSLIDWVEAVETVAQKLTVTYAEQLNQLSSVKEESIKQSLPWRQSQAVVANDVPETAIEFVADYAVLCMLKAMLVEKVKAETLVADLVRSVIYPEAMSSKISFIDSIKENFDETPILSIRLVTIHNQLWQLEEVFTKPGIKIINDLDDSCTYYAGNEHEPALYGYRHGMLMEVQMHPEWQKHFAPYERSNISIPMSCSTPESSSSSAARDSRSILSQSSSPQNPRSSSAQLSFFPSADAGAKNTPTPVAVDSTPIPSGFPSVLEKYEISPQKWVVSLYRKPAGQNPDHPYILIESLDIAKRASLHRYDLQAIGQIAHVRREMAQGLALNNHDIWATFFERFAIREQVRGVSWSVSWEIGMELIKALDRMVESQIQIAYGLRGSYSKFSSRAEHVENCYTWARNKLIEHLGKSAVELVLPSTWCDWIVATPRLYI